MPRGENCRVGEAQHCAKLTEEAVLEIRKAPASVGNRELGARYGVSGVAAWKARTRRSWKHVA